MAQQSPSELAREVQRELYELRAEFLVIRAEVDRGDLPQIRDRIAVVEVLIAEIRRSTEESDRRRWQLWLGIDVVVITFVANLTINMLMFFARKSA